VEVDSIPEDIQEKIAPAGSADLVVGLLAGLSQTAIAELCEALGNLPGSPRIVVLQTNPPGQEATINSPAADANSPVSLLPWSVAGPDPTAAQVQSIPAAFHSLFAATEKMSARACCLIASEMESPTPHWICQMLHPLLDSDWDLVLPYYAPRKLQGLLNSSILYPLTRCLYGKTIHNPLGPDVAVSRRLAQRILGANPNSNGNSNLAHPLTSLAPVASCENMQICQVHVGARVYPPMDWMNMSSLIAQVMGSVFLEMERSVACWQRTRGSVSVPTRGEPLPAPEETAALDVNRMVETFQLGVRDLQEIWSLVLPPATLLELRKLSRLKPEQVYMPDDLWARIVYDFALAHRLRTINRDHLLRSMTPLYLAWVVSYARDLETVGAGTVEQRIERLALAYEAAKPYLISRWRWPDRFNP
jgi:glucosylglycerate synthase